MRYDGIDMAYRKYATWAIYGAKIDPELATEVIRRTDSFFMSFWGQSPYQRAIKRLLGMPLRDDHLQHHESGYPTVDTNWLHRELDRFMSAWGCVHWSDDPERPHYLSHLSNVQVACGMGWCYPDGTIALYDEIKRGYPSLIYDECDAVAKAFPEIEFSVVYWGKSGPEPSAGFIVRDGCVEGTGGTDPDVFARFGVDHRNVEQAAEDAGKRAHDALPTESKFADRMFDQTRWEFGPVRGVPDAVVEQWISEARDLGLAPIKT